MVMVLRDEATGVYVWSESFRLSLDNWFEAQQRIIRRIATSLNVQLSAERLMRLAGEPDVSLDMHDRWLRGQSLHFKYDAESWQRAVAIFRDAIRENPDVLALLQQPRADEQYRTHRASRLLPRSRQGEGDARTGEDRRSTGSGRFQGASVLRLVLCDGAPRGRGGAAYGACLRTERQRPVDPVVRCALLRLLRIDRAGSAAGRAVAGSFARASISRMGLPWHHPLPLRRLCRRSCRPCDRARGATHLVPAWRAAALFHLGEPVRAREEAQRFLNGIRSFWVGSSAPTDEAVARWALQAHPISIRSRWEALRDGLRGAGLPVEGVVQLSQSRSFRNSS